jgi:hypothetical protein
LELGCASAVDSPGEQSGSLPRIPIVRSSLLVESKTRLERQLEFWVHRKLESEFLELALYHIIKSPPLMSRDAPVM